MKTAEQDCQNIEAQIGDKNNQQQTLCSKREQIEKEASKIEGYLSANANDALLISEQLVDINKLGAIITKTITKDPKMGNPTPRLAETSAGMLNAIGLQNEGIEDFIKIKLPKLKKIKTKIIVSISANTEKDFVFLAQKLQDNGVEAIEINLSCPNVKHNIRSKENTLFAQDAAATFRLINVIKKNTSIMSIAKLSPNVTSISSIAAAAEDAGAEALSLVNTFLALAIDIKTRRPKLANITGGLSGPCIKPIALRMVHEAANTVKIPILGMGGILTAEDAIEFMLAGATAVSIGTANFVEPSVSMKVIEGTEQYLLENKIKNINEIIGSIIK